MSEAVGMDSLFGQDRTDVLVELLWNQPEWPKDPVKDRDLVGQLMREFPQMDLADELGKWMAWMIGKGQLKMVKGNGRFSRVRNWCRNAERYRRTNGGRQAGRRAGNGSRPAASVSGGAPAAREAFQDGARLVDWA